MGVWLTFCKGTCAACFGGTAQAVVPLGATRAVFVCHCVLLPLFDQAPSKVSLLAESHQCNQCIAGSLTGVAPVGFCCQQSVEQTNGGTKEGLPHPASANTRRSFASLGHCMMQCTAATKTCPPHVCTAAPDFAAAAVDTQLHRRQHMPCQWMPLNSSTQVISSRAWLVGAHTATIEWLTMQTCLHTPHPTNSQAYGPGPTPQRLHCSSWMSLPHIYPPCRVSWLLKDPHTLGADHIHTMLHWLPW